MGLREQPLAAARPNFNPTFQRTTTQFFLPEDMRNNKRSTGSTSGESTDVLEAAATETPETPATSEPPGPAPAPDPAPPKGGGRRKDGLNITELKDMSIAKLTQIAKDHNAAVRRGCANRT